MIKTAQIALRISKPCSILSIHRLCMTLMIFTSMKEILLSYRHHSSRAKAKSTSHTKSATTLTQWTYRTRWSRRTLIRRSSQCLERKIRLPSAKALVLIGIMKIWNPITRLKGIRIMIRRSFLNRALNQEIWDAHSKFPTLSTISFSKMIMALMASRSGSSFQFRIRVKIVPTALTSSTWWNLNLIITWAWGLLFIQLKRPSKIKWAGNARETTSPTTSQRGVSAKAAQCRPRTNPWVLQAWMAKKWVTEATDLIITHSPLKLSSNMTTIRCTLHIATHLPIRI